MSLKFEVISLGQLYGGGVEQLTHLYAAIAHLLCHVYVVEELRSDRLQCVFRPRLQTTLNSCQSGPKSAADKQDDDRFQTARTRSEATSCVVFKLEAK